jgi:hypothetical protein
LPPPSAGPLTALSSALVGIEIRSEGGGSNARNCDSGSSSKTGASKAPRPMARSGRSRNESPLIATKRLSSNNVVSPQSFDMKTTRSCTLGLEDGHSCNRSAQPQPDDHRCGAARIRNCGKIRAGRCLRSRHHPQRRNGAQCPKNQAYPIVYGGDMESA